MDEDDFLVKPYEVFEPRFRKKLQASGIEFKKYMNAKTYNTVNNIEIMAKNDDYMKIRIANKMLEDTIRK